jgi:hypothetical protein
MQADLRERILPAVLGILTLSQDAVGDPSNWALLALHSSAGPKNGGRWGH